MIQEALEVRPWPFRFFRAVTSVQLALVLAQATFAGGFLSGHYGMLAMHRANAGLVVVTALVQVAAAAYLLRGAGHPRWPLALSLAIVIMIAAQIPLGFARLLMLHVPLAVIIIAGVALSTVRAWQLPQRDLRPILREAS
jgi:heme A synthase